MERQTNGAHKRIDEEDSKRLRTICYPIMAIQSW